MDPRAQRVLILLVSVWFGLGLNMTSPADARLPIDPQGLMAGYFDQGKAEFLIYDATIPRYGQPRPATVTHIWVKEPWDNQRGVKHQGQGRGDGDVIKLNQVISYPTGMYRYEQMWSGFWKRETADLVKFTLSHHEACGNTFKQLRFNGDQAQFVYFSYFEGHGDGSVTFTPSAGTIFYDELPLKLRLLVPSGLAEPVTVPLIPTVIHAKSDSMEPAPATVRQARRDGKEIEFEVQHLGGTDRLIYETEAPHKLLRWEMADGSSLRLRQALFTDYWNRNQPGDEKLLP